MMTRDIRLVALTGQLRDFRDRAPRDRFEWRKMQLAEIMAAWQCLAFDEYDHPIEVSMPWDPSLLGIPGKQDRLLVQEAILLGCHVFMTRDEAILRHSIQASHLGIVVASPTDLALEFVTGSAAGAFGADGLVADNHRWVHWFRIADGETANLH